MKLLHEKISKVEEKNNKKKRKGKVNGKQKQNKKNTLELGEIAKGSCLENNKGKK